MKTVSLIVPVYKKADIIAECLTMQLKVLRAICKKYKLDYELLAVVDGHLDNSAEIIKKIKNSHIRLISYKHNRGKGFAVRLGMMQASGDYLGFMDAGLDMDPVVIKHMVNALVKNPKIHIVVANKRHAKSKLIYPLKRKLFTKGYAFIVKIFTGIDYQDTQVGAKMFTREVVDQFLPRILVKRFAFDVEILAVANYLGHKKHIDVPVNIDFTVDISSATNVKQILHMIWDTMAVGYRLRIRRYYSDANHKNWGDSLYDLLSQNVTKIL